MDTTSGARHAALIERVLAAAPIQGLEWEFSPTPPRVGRTGADAAVRIRLAGQELSFLVDVKRGLRPSLLGAVIHQLAAYGDAGLLLTDYVTPQMADELRARGIQFIDAAGNAYLNRPPLFVWVKGQRLGEAIDAVEPRGRAFQASGLRVLFALLCRPDAANLPYRDLAVLAGVAHGTVGWVMAELPRLGLLVEINKRRRLTDGDRLLKDWVVAYARTLRPKLTLARYQTASLDWTHDIDAAAWDLLLGGEPAARRLTGHLRPGTATFYGEKPSARLLADQRLRPDRQGNVEVLRRFWTFEGEESGLVPIVLVYADLLSTRDARCREVAEELHERIATRLD